MGAVVFVRGRALHRGLEAGGVIGRDDFYLVVLAEPVGVGEFLVVVLQPRISFPLWTGRMDSHLVQGSVWVGLCRTQGLGILRSCIRIRHFFSFCSREWDQRGTARNVDEAMTSSRGSAILGKSGHSKTSLLELSSAESLQRERASFASTSCHLASLSHPRR